MKEPAADRVDILVVDDDPAKRLAIVSVLESLGQNVVVVQSGREALRLLLDRTFAVILLDVQMPVMDGFETAALIRTRESSQYTPIIFITAFSRAEVDVTRGYSLGAVDYIFTPIVADVLRAKVGTFVELHRKAEAMQRQEQRLHELEMQEHKQKLVETVERLEMETQRNRFFTLSLELLAIAGFDGYFKQLNPTWEKTLGFASQELLSKPLLDFVHPADRPAATGELEKLADSASHASFESRCLCKDESWRWLSWSAAAFEQEDLIYIFARDVTERKYFENALMEKNAALEASNKELESFSYSVSHDLRSPLRAIDGFSRILQKESDGKLTEEAQRVLHVIVSNTQKMGRLIDDLLRFSRVGRLSVALTQFDMNALVQEVLNGLPTALDEHAPRLMVKPLPPARGDRSLLRQVWINLLSNAIKFSSRSAEPSIEVGGYTENTENVYYVKDNGAGFNMQYYDKLFGVFQRLHSTEQFDGTGVGLAIVQRVVTRHGGRVWAVGKENEGATFYFAVPREDSKGAN